jgi:NAD(P)-dependent dehydrogenase (short-subunit alcohol dehydrogenase family)
LEHYMNKLALVTGASSGIGEATVRRLLTENFIVYAAARRLDRMMDLKANGARLIQLDLTDDASIVSAVDTVHAESGRLDVLVNNAGYGSYGALEDVPIAEARRQFEVNLFGLARLCQLALPIMRAQQSGRIINVSSIGGKGGEPFGAWYHATKFAVEGLSDSLRMELIPFGIEVAIIEPGAIRTEWGGIAHKSMIEMSGHTAYGPYVAKHARMHDQAFKSASAPETVADAIAHAATAQRPQIRYPVGSRAKLAVLLARFLPDRAKDRLSWRMSQANS